MSSANQDPDVEARFIEQEHRFHRVFTNAWTHWHNTGPLGLASRRAVFWYILSWLFAPPNAVTIGTGLVALLGLWFAFKGNELIEAQNQLIEAQRRASLVTELSNILDQIDSGNSQSTDDGHVRLSPNVLGRIVAFSHSLQPYRYLGVDGLEAGPLSPERGQLLVSLVRSKVYITDLTEADFTFADLEGKSVVSANLFGINLQNANLDRAKLAEVDFSYTNLCDTRFSDADLWKADLSGANAANADFRDADLRGANLSEAILTRAKFKGAKLKGADLRGANLTNAAISRSQIQEAFVDAKTVLPSW